MNVREFLARYEVVTEEDARERERVAYRMGWLDTPLHNGRESDMVNGLERRYPSLVQKPKTVTLSNGMTYRLAKVTGFPWARVDLDGEEYIEQPRCLSVEDFEKCAALLREEEANL